MRLGTIFALAGTAPLLFACNPMGPGSTAATGYTPGLVNPSVTISGDGNESISATGTQTVTYGAAEIVTVTANANYSLNTIVGGTCPSGTWSGVNYTTGAITESCTLIFSAVYSPTYTVTPSGDGNETFSPGSAQAVASGAPQTFTVTPDAGYAINNTVGGTCPTGNWSAGVYTTGAITSSCSVVFGAVTAATLAFEGASASELNLSPIYNFIGIATDGSTFNSSQGFDHDGNSYSSSCLTSPSLTYDSVTYSIGTPNADDVFNNASGIVLNVPSSNYSTLWVLAAGVNGNQNGQDFVFNYATGSPVVISQNLSDWGTGPAGYSNENVALTCAYRDTYAGGQDASHDFYVYAYPLTLDSTRALQSVQTPANANVQIIALTLL
jgi:hypothetical protein